MSITAVKCVLFITRPFGVISTIIFGAKLEDVYDAMCN